MRTPILLTLALAALVACTDTPVSPPGNPPAPPTVTPPTPPVLPPPTGQLPVPPAQNIVTYAGLNSNQRFNAVVSLSDGTFLVGGQAQNLNWLAQGTPRIALSAGAISSASAGNIGFLAHLSGDFQTVLRVAAFPAGTVRDVNRIRLSNLPGATTGDLFISGSRDNGGSDGYYLAKLNANFVTAAPTGLSWTYDVSASGDHKDRQPWDVGSDGRIVYALGRPIDVDWAAIQRLSPNGQPEPVQNWSAHWSNGAEWDGTPASSAPAAVQYSALVMKAGRKGSLRSRTQAEFDANLPDGNGRTDRKGTYPDDYYFNSPCDLKSACTASGPGYTGYKTGKPTQRVGGIAIDRRNDDLYFGYGTQTVLPDGNPDFEPAVVAMDSSGALKWWSRLYHERTDKTGGGFNTTSSPDQYVDHLAIDYSNNCAGGCLTVLARAHGNNVINFWSGNKIAAQPSASGFQNQFTGTSGNIHISWLGKLQLGGGALQRATWLAEWAEGATLSTTPSSDPLMDGWPSPNSGWPNLNTTRAQSLDVDLQGQVFVTALGRRTITTANAQQKMIKPSAGKSTWNAFARVYSPDLSRLVYSSLTVGAWDPVTEAGGGNTELRAVAPLNGGLAAVGVHTATSGTANGNPVPTVRVPAWGASAPAGETALLTAIRFY